MLSGQEGGAEKAQSQGIIALNGHSQPSEGPESKIETPEVDGSGNEKESGEIQESASNDSLESDTETEKKDRFQSLRKNAVARRIWSFVTYTPPRCRWDPETPPKFSMALNLLFGFVSMISVSERCL
jgi:hypothetical protein